MSGLRALAYDDAPEYPIEPQHFMCQSAHVHQSRVRQMAHEIPVRPTHSESFRNAIHEIPYKLGLVEADAVKTKPKKKKSPKPAAEKTPEKVDQEPAKVTVDRADGYLECNDDIELIFD